MNDEAHHFLRDFEARVQPVSKAQSIARWNLETTGEEQYIEECERLEIELLKHYSDREVFVKVKDLRESMSDTTSDPDSARAIDIVYRDCAGHQMSQETIEELAKRGVQLDACYNQFRALFKGEKVADNVIDDCLKNETNSSLVEEAWRASKTISHFRGEGGSLAEVHQQIRELVKVRNRGAKEVGFENYYQMSVELSELGLDWLFETLDALAEASDEPFNTFKTDLDGQLAQRFGCDTADLRPWHYGDRFFQTAPKAGRLNLDAVFEGRDLVDLTIKTFDALGLETRPIVDKSDLFPGDPKTSKKCQHAFCIGIDAPDDVRILCNVVENHRWMGTMLHEFGHGVDSAGLSLELPYFFRRHAHTLTTEAIALMMERHCFNARWLQVVVGLSVKEAEKIQSQARAEFAVKHLIFTRWVLVMCNFERALYERPDELDLDTLWWDLVEKYQSVTRPGPEHSEPDWASKIHLAGAPAYYQNYLLGEVFGAQLEDHIEKTFGPLALNRKAGEFLNNEMFANGARWPWRELLRRLTGEDLKLEPFVAKLSG